MKISDNTFYAGLGVVIVIAVLLAGLKPFQMRLNQGSDSNTSILKKAPADKILMQQGNTLPPVLDQTGAIIEGAYTSLEEVTLGGIEQ